METQDIRLIARHQHLRRVELVEVGDGSSLIRIRVRAADACVAWKSQPVGNPSSGPDPVVAAAPNQSSIVTVKSQCLGIFRSSHPSRAQTAVEIGDSVAEGQPLALLQLGDAYTSVNAPCAGIVEHVLVKDGQRIDYGMALFQLNSDGR